MLLTIENVKYGPSSSERRKEMLFITEELARLHREDLRSEAKKRRLVAEALRTCADVAAKALRRPVRRG